MVYVVADIWFQTSTLVSSTADFSNTFDKFEVPTKFHLAVSLWSANSYCLAIKILLYTVLSFF